MSTPPEARRPVLDSAKDRMSWVCVRDCAVLTHFEGSFGSFSSLIISASTPEAKMVFSAAL